MKDVEEKSGVEEIHGIAKAALSGANELQNLQDQHLHHQHLHHQHLHHQHLRQRRRTT